MIYGAIISKPLYLSYNSCCNIFPCRVLRGLISFWKDFMNPWLAQTIKVQHLSAHAYYTRHLMRSHSNFSHCSPLFVPQMSPCSRTWLCLSSMASVAICSSMNSCGVQTSHLTLSLWIALTWWWQVPCLSRQVQTVVLFLPWQPFAVTTCIAGMYVPSIYYPVGFLVANEPRESCGRVLPWQLPVFSLYQINHNHMKMEN